MSNNGNVLTHLRSALKEFYDFDKNETRQVGLKGRELTPERYALLKDLFHLVLFTDIVNEETKTYLKVDYISMSDMADYLSERDNQVYDKRVIINKIAYSRNKLSKLLGDTIVVDIVDYTNRDVSKYFDILRDARMKYEDFNCLNDFVLDFKDIKASVKPVSKERILDVLRKIQPYRKDTIEEFEKALDKEAISYIKYIGSSEGILESEKEISLLVRRMLR